MAAAFGFVRSKVMVGPVELTLTEVEHGTELLFPSAVVTQRLEFVVAVSAFEDDGCGWLCSPSYVATSID